jgi:predicted  nucleic acid-binding Zn-ribbon protein
MHLPTPEAQAALAEWRNRTTCISCKEVVYKGTDENCEGCRERGGDRWDRLKEIREERKRKRLAYCQEQTKCVSLKALASWMKELDTEEERVEEARQRWLEELRIREEIARERSRNRFHTDQGSQITTADSSMDRRMIGHAREGMKEESGHRMQQLFSQSVQRLRRLLIRK